MKATLKGLYNKVVGYSDEFRWWCWERGVSGLAEKAAMGLFILLASVACVILSPFLITMGIGWCAWRAIQWLQDKVAITLVCTLAGLLCGVCGGATGAACGAAFGFFMGIVFELVRLADANSGTWKNSNLFGVYEDHHPQTATGNGAATYNNYGGIIRVKHYERPWSWKGFQVHKGPKEDDLRKDL